MMSNINDGELKARPSEEQVETWKEKLNQLFQPGDLFANLKMSTILRLFRFASLALSMLLFMLHPYQEVQPFWPGWVVVMPIAALTATFLYERYWHKARVMIVLVTIEVTGASILLATTGGFGGPFLWYALNPFIVSAVLFPFALNWIFLGLLIIATFIMKVSMFRSELAPADILSLNLFSLLNLVIIVMIIHLFARMQMTIFDQHHEGKSQRKELLTAYQDLTMNYYIFQELTAFQKEVVSYNNQRDIYSALIASLINAFPFKRAAVLIPHEAYSPSDSSDHFAFQIIGAQGEEKNTIDPLILGEIEERWQEFARPGKRRQIIGKNNKWIAVPLQGTKDTITAVFIGWQKQRINPLSFADNLSIFIRFTEQSTEWLSMFMQKERVLQHISSIYKAVEAVSSYSDSRKVIELFASYGRTLTDSEKAIFWLEYSGKDQLAGYDPVFAVKGPGNVFPEEMWRDTLLQAWSEICDNKKPVVLDLPLSADTEARLIGVPVISGSHCLGLMAGIYTHNKYNIKEIIQTLSVLADLSTIAVEKTRAEKFTEKMLLNEEQRRIAREIHDTISQNLFSIVYSIDALSKKAGRSLDRQARESMNDIKNLSAETARELRALIYRLNPREDSSKTFINEVGDYLDKLARMNSIYIKQSLSGDAEYLNPAICKTFFRILKESTGNALRHSACSEIQVDMQITPFQSVLKISDNGTGFDLENSPGLYTAGDRLGLVNMRELTLALKGSIDIRSEPGRGTEVTCSIPTSPVSVE